MAENWLHETENVPDAIHKVWESMQYGKMPEQHAMMVIMSAAKQWWEGQLK